MFIGQFKGSNVPCLFETTRHFTYVRILFLLSIGNSTLEIRYGQRTKMMKEFVLKPAMLQPIGNLNKPVLNVPVYEVASISLHKMQSPDQCLGMLLLRDINLGHEQVSIHRVSC